MSDSGKLSVELKTLDTKGQFDRRAVLAMLGVGVGIGALGGATAAPDRAIAAGFYSWPIDPIFPPTEAGQRFGTPRPGRTHEGSDYNVGSLFLGKPVLAVADGTIIAGQWVQQASGSQQYVLGNYVRIRHADGNSSTYAHLRSAPAVALGVTVTRGTTVGSLGSTGTNVPHLHFELRNSANVPFDSVTFIQANLAPTTPETKGQSMYIIRSTDGSIYLCTAFGITRIGSPSHVQLFQRLLGSGSTGDTFNATEVNTMKAYIEGLIK